MLDINDYLISQFVKLSFVSVVSVMDEDLQIFELEMELSNIELCLLLYKRQLDEEK